MKTLWGLLLAFLFIQLILACPTNTIKLTSNSISSCEAIFYWDQECKEAQFDFCRIKICLLERTYKNGTTKCFSFSDRIEYNYTACMKTCCPSIMNQNNPYQSANTCSKLTPASSQSSSSQSSSFSSTLRIILITLGVICLTIILGYAYYRCNLRREEPIISNADANPEQLREEKSQQLLITNLKWQKNSVKEQILTQCVICLEERPNLQLQCRHLFHANCFRSWLRKKSQCGICRSKKIQSFTLKCNKCSQTSVKLNYATLMKKRYDYTNIICSDCMRKK